jgi:hypothetical protein
MTLLEQRETQEMTCMYVCMQARMIEMKWKEFLTTLFGQFANASENQLHIHIVLRKVARWFIHKPKIPIG